MFDEHSNATCEEVLRFGRIGRVHAEHDASLMDRAIALDPRILDKVLQ